MAFSPQPGCSANFASELWVSLGLDKLVEPRTWMSVTTVSDGDELHDAVAKAGREPVRSLLVIPNGEYTIQNELNLECFPLLDIVGESRDGVAISCGSLCREAVVYTKATSTLLAHLTLKRIGRFDEMFHARYAIHDNSHATEPRLVIFADLSCITAPEVGCNGIGTGVSAGETHLYVGVDSPMGFFAHNADDNRARVEHGTPLVDITDPARLVYLNCTGKCVRYWNQGSRTKDILAICGGSIESLEISDIVPTFGGHSETEVLLWSHTNIMRGTKKPTATVIKMVDL